MSACYVTTVFKLRLEGWEVELPLLIGATTPISGKFQSPLGVATTTPPHSSLLIEYYFVIAVIIYWTSRPTRK